jgi:hypothetical protein
MKKNNCVKFVKIKCTSLYLLVRTPNVAIAKNIFMNKILNDGISTNILKLSPNFMMETTNNMGNE